MEVRLLGRDDREDKNTKDWDGRDPKRRREEPASQGVCYLKGQLREVLQER